MTHKILSTCVALLISLFASQVFAEQKLSINEVHLGMGQKEAIKVMKQRCKDFSLKRHMSYSGGLVHYSDIYCYQEGGYPNTRISRASSGYLEEITGYLVLQEQKELFDRGSVEMLLKRFIAKYGIPDVTVWQTPVRYSQGIMCQACWGECGSKHRVNNQYWNGYKIGSSDGENIFFEINSNPYGESYTVTSLHLSGGDYDSRQSKAFTKAVEQEREKSKKQKVNSIRLE